MGFFSWKTSDTERSIPSMYSDRPTFPVKVLWKDGTEQVERCYEGYGTFDGVDLYEEIIGRVPSLVRL
jgi:hypothetical protein